jgi:hypothetical protein
MLGNHVRIKREILEKFQDGLVDTKSEDSGNGKEAKSKYQNIKQIRLAKALRLILREELDHKGQSAKCGHRNAKHGDGHQKLSQSIGVKFERINP